MADKDYALQLHRQSFSSLYDDDISQGKDSTEESSRCKEYLQQHDEVLQKLLCPSQSRGDQRPLDSPSRL